MGIWNEKRFSVYTSDEKNVLGLIEELGDITNNNTTKLEEKTNLMGDHKGTWQGLSKPTLSQEGATALTEKNAKDILNILSTEYNFLNYGGKVKNGNEVFDNKPIFEKIFNDMIASDGGTLILPTGIIETSFLDLTLPEYRGLNIKIKGQSPSTRSYQTMVNRGMINTTIKFLTYTKYGIKTCSDNATGYDSGTKGFVLEGVILDGDKKVTNCINGNYNLVINNCAITGAIENGLVCENWTYPVTLEKSSFCYNGLHGIFIKGNMSTVINLNDCECYWNDGYGLYMEGGSNSLFTSLLCQSNKLGGVKIYKKNIVGTNLLDNITFIKLYTENNNGYACYISTEGEDTGEVDKMISRINFINSSLNSQSGNKSLRIGGVFGCQLDVEGLTQDSIEFGGVNFGVELRTGATIADTVNVPNDKMLTSYYKHNGAMGKVCNYGLFHERGHVKELRFKATKDLITRLPNQTIEMDITEQLLTLNKKGYPISSSSSLVGIELRKAKWNESDRGVVTTSVRVYDSQSGINMGSSQILTRATMNIFSQVLKSVKYDYDLYKIKSGSNISVVLETSADYSVVNLDESEYIVTLLIEH